MSRLDHQRVMNLLAEALELPPTARESFLDSTCGGQSDLRLELDELLACAEQAQAAFDAASEQIVPPDPQQIGPYEILEPIGEGGMAIVYKAQQQAPVRRLVALKLIKLGMDTRQFVARFESERQALAMMDHPNVARVFDAGSTDTGRPYFVMEYVPGVSLLDYCDQHHLGLRQRLELFIVICDAVEHAHRKGIIHRDIKDSNVLVSEIDGKPVPKVIDFGVAKAIQQPLSDRALQTEQGQLIGTPEYMSPEQAERGTMDIDTRSDVYSLGVLLYELIAGVQPIPSELLRSAGYEQVQRIIRETQPPRPSTRLSTLGGADATQIAQRRQIALPTLIRQLRSELEWIPLKAMRKDREQRYRSAAELADDIANYLSHRPLLAGPESGWYRARKFLRRHKLGVAASAAMVFLLIAGTTATSWETIRAKHAEAQASEARDIAQATLDFVVKDVFAGASPESIPDAKVRDQIIAAMVTPAADRVTQSFKDRPLAQAAVQQAIGTVLLQIGRADLALPHDQTALEIRRRLLGENHHDTISALNSYALDLFRVGHVAEAEPLLKQALEHNRQVLGAEHPETMTAMNNYAHVLYSLGRYAEAEQSAKQVLECRRRLLGEDNPQTIDALGMYAAMLHAQGRVADAEPLFRQAMEGSERVRGSDHPETLKAMSNYAAVLQSLGRSAQAAPLCQELVERSRRVFGDDHPQTILVLGNCASILNSAGRAAEALPLCEEALDRSRRVLGEDHPQSIYALSLNARILNSLGRPADAEPLARQAVAKAAASASLGPRHPRTKSYASTHANILDALGRHDDAATVRSEFGVPDPTTHPTTHPS